MTSYMLATISPTLAIGAVTMAHIVHGQNIVYDILGMICMTTLGIATSAHLCRQEDNKKTEYRELKTNADRNIEYRKNLGQLETIAN